MPESKGSKPTRRWRIWGAVRKGLLSLALFLAGALAWLNFVGVPGFVQERVSQGLQEKGLRFDAERMRLFGFNQILLGKARLRSVARQDSIEAEEVGLSFSLRGIFSSPELRQVRIKDGFVEIPTGTNETERVQIRELNGMMNFSGGSSNVVVELGHAEILGIKVRMHGTVANWDELIFSSNASKSAGVNWIPLVERVRTVVSKIRADPPPQLDLRFSTDGRRSGLTTAKLSFSAARAASPWGKLSKVSLSIVAQPDESSKELQVDSHLEITGMKSRWAEVNQVTYHSSMSWPTSSNQTFRGSGNIVMEDIRSGWGGIPRSTIFFKTGLKGGGDEFETVLEAAIEQPRSGKIRADRCDLAGTFNHQKPLRFGPGLGDLASDTSVTGSWNISVTNFVSSIANAHHLTGKGDLRRSNDSEVAMGGLWKELARWQSKFKLEASQAQKEEVVIGNTRVDGEWVAPLLSMRNAEAELYGGQIQLDGALDLLSREITSQFAAQFNYHGAEPLLDRPVAKRLAEFSWEIPPQIKGRVKFQLPPWTNDWSNFREVMLSTIDLNAEVEGTAAYREIPFDRIRTSVRFTNYTWSLPDLEVLRPEGHASIAYEGDDRTQDFKAYINSHLDPRMIGPLLEEEPRKALNMVGFSRPPELEGELTGNWKDLSTLGFVGKLRASNFTIKQEPVADLQARLSYKSNFVQGEELIIHRVAGEEITAPWLLINIAEKTMAVTNVLSTADPYIAMKLVGPETYRAIEPYRFTRPPLVKLHGIVPLSDPPDAADLHFEVSGDEFTYWRFKLPAVSGNIHWRDDDLWITNVHGSFYNGKLDWHGHFYFNDDDTADFSFEALVKEADAKLLLNDLAKGNKMEGTVDGRLVITSANSDQWKSWNGFGNADLSDGFLWDIPVFGIFTPMLEAVAPGLGISKVSAGSANFRITNSVISTKDLHVRAPAFRLRYKGEVDFEGNLRAKMEALLLRDAWLFGRVLSATLWPLSKVFEAEISGTVESPKSKLKHFPAWATAPLRPFQTMKELFQGKPRKRQGAPNSTTQP